jgi:hypothetical protein
MTVAIRRKHAVAIRVVPLGHISKSQ